MRAVKPVGEKRGGFGVNLMGNALRRLECLTFTCPTCRLHDQVESFDFIWFGAVPRRPIKSEWLQFSDSVNASMPHRF